MKVVLLALLAIVIGLFAYNVATTGELRLLPAAAPPEEVQLDHLQARLDEAQERLEVARRSAGQAGVEARAAAQRELDAIASQLDELREQWETKARAGAQGARKVLGRLQDRLRHKADKLQRALDAFRRELR
jgi:uncharacterized membrane-anchored protein YhcB (DUF1043 family)